ncbi:hypothetical protein ABE28_012360 [Peribacillus muralis]|uniref:Uncharacterized protein n=2 Tax=Peribacillus muralis TaxID=264697 RepID=A0A1B3XPK6_9BACI|nr:hypothetical protein ABE28_012360 [Peribacillus muralis]
MVMLQRMFLKTKSKDYILNQKILILVKKMLMVNLNGLEQTLMVAFLHIYINLPQTLQKMEKSMVDKEEKQKMVVLPSLVKRMLNSCIST